MSNASPQVPHIRSGINHYVMELIIIVSGITLSFALNGWWQDRLGQESLVRDLKTIQINMESDRSELLSLTKDREQALPAMYRLTNYATGGDEPENAPELMLSMSSAGFSFFPDTGAWKAMVASGNLRWINDDSLKGSLSRYYDHAVPRILDNNRLLDALVVRGLLAWVGGEVSPKSPDDTGYAHVNLSKIDKESLRRHIGRVAGHTKWYNDLLGITLQQLDEAMAAVTTKLAAST